MQNEEIINKEELIPTVQKMLNAKVRFCTATCLDLGEQFELLYHFEPKEAVEPLTTLRLKVNKDETVPSISGIYGCAVIAENEITGSFKIQITGMPLDFQGKIMLTADSIQFPLSKTVSVPDLKSDKVNLGKLK